MKTVRKSLPGFAGHLMQTATNTYSERDRRAFMSSVAAGVSKVISVLTMLASIPMTLNYLGAERYGMWATLSSFVILFSFADLGIGNGLLNAISNANGRDDRREIRHLISSAYAILTGISIFLALALALIFPLIDWGALLNVRSETAINEARISSAVFILCIFGAIPLNVVDRTQEALQSGYSASLWRCASSLVVFAGIVTIIQVGAGVPWLVAAFAGLPLVMKILNAAVYFGLQARDIAPSPSCARYSEIGKITEAGLLFFVLQMVIAVAFGSDNLIIAHYLGAESVTQYSVPVQMFNLVSVPINIVLMPLWPAYGEAIARGDHDWVRKTFKRSMTFALLLSGTLTILLVIFGKWILAYWAGSELQPSVFLLLTLCVWKIMEACGNAFSMIFNGANIIRFQIVTSSLMCISAISLKFLLVQKIGIEGIVLATVIAFGAMILVPAALKFRAIMNFLI